MPDRPGSVMLFAAGLGTRMGALTATRPKPLIPVAGKPLIDHALELVLAYGASRIIANTHYHPNQIARHLKDTSVLLSDEQPDILETGGGLRAAIPLLGRDPVFTMNTDVVWKGANPLETLAQHWQADRMDALLLCVPKKQAHGHIGDGDFVINQTGQASRGPGMVYSGLQIIKTDTLYEIEQRCFSLNILWDQMLAKKRLFALPYSGIWCDVGQPESINIAEAMLSGADV